MAEQFGIEKTKPALSIIINEINVADTQFADGFQGTDLIPIILALAPVTEVAKSWDQIKQEASDYSEAEIIEMASFINSGIKIKNQDLQEKIRKYVNAAAYNYIAFKPKKKEVVATEPVQN